VCIWLRSRFPGHNDVQARFRVDCGPAQVLPTADVAMQTQGAAIDWWIRFLADPGPRLGLVLEGLIKERQAPCFKAGMMMLAGLRAIDRDLTLLAVNAARFRAESDEWQARVCFALALLTELRRASSFDGSRLMRLGPDSTPRDLLTLANRAEVADLIAMRDLARPNLLPALPAGPVASGAVFDGSEDLNADADLIAGGHAHRHQSRPGRQAPQRRHPDRRGPAVIVCAHPCSHGNDTWGGMELAEQITGRVAELTGEVELLRKQLADAEHELERLVIAGQVITQLMTDGAAAGSEPAGTGAAQRGFGLLVPPRSQASGTGDLPGDYRSLVEAVAAAAAETGGPVPCVMAAQRAGIDVTGRQSENVRAKLKRLEDRGWLRRSAAGKFTIAP
jgi:hypothetical protein